MSRSPLVAEFMGTFALVLIGAGSAAVGFGGLCGIALAHGLVLSLMIASLCSVSGGHFNPAISFMMWIQKKIDNNTFFSYLAAQMVASFSAAFVLWVLLSGAVADFGSTRVSDSLSLMQGFLIESLLTFFLGWVILRSSTKSWAPLAIGACLTVCILFAGTLTGASLNPARSFGPCFFSGAIEDLWVYLLAPFIGAGLVAVAEPWLPGTRD